MTPQLYDYQLDVLERGRRRMRQGCRRLIIQADTGSGKTHIVAEMARCCHALGKRMLILAHRRKLIQQISERLYEFGVPHGTIMSGSFRGRGALIQVASRDTLLAGNLDTLPEAELVIIDECHNLLTNGYLAIAGRYRGAFIVGFTATPCRGDGRGLGEYFDAMECAVSTSELIRRGRLCPVLCYSATRAGLDRKEGKQVKGLSGDPVAHWLELAKDRPTLLFASNVAASLAVTKRFSDAGIAAEHVDSNTPEDERDAVEERLKDGATKIVCNANLWTEGVDIPPVACVVMFRKFEPFVAYKQAIGRGMRTCPGKIDCVVIDHSGCVMVHGLPDEDVRWTLDTSEKVEDRNLEDRERTEREPVTCPKCGFMFTAMPACPCCGHALKPRPAPAMSIAENELLEEVKRENAGYTAQESMQRHWLKFVSIAKAKGRTAKFAAGMFKKQFGKPPWEANVNPLPDREDWGRPVSDIWPSWGRRRKPTEDAA